MISAQRKYCHPWGHGGALHRMQDAGRIIHHAKGVYGGAKHLTAKPTTYVVGKARAHEQHLLARGDAERGTRYIYNCSKLHVRKKSFT